MVSIVALYNMLLGISANAKSKQSPPKCLGSGASQTGAQAERPAPRALACTLPGAVPPTQPMQGLCMVLWGHCIGASGLLPCGVLQEGLPQAFPALGGPWGGLLQEPECFGGFALGTQLAGGLEAGEECTWQAGAWGWALSFLPLVLITSVLQRALPWRTQDTWVPAAAPSLSHLSLWTEFLPLPDVDSGPRSTCFRGGWG